MIKSVSVICKREREWQVKGSQASFPNLPNTHHVLPPSFYPSPLCWFNIKQEKLWAWGGGGCTASLWGVRNQREWEKGWPRPGLGITYQRPWTPNQPRLDSLAPASAYLPQTSTGGPVRATVPCCSPNNTATSTSTSVTTPPTLMTSLLWKLHIQHQMVTPLKVGKGERGRSVTSLGKW